jgi:hypothetical protein
MVKLLTPPGIIKSIELASNFIALVRALRKSGDPENMPAQDCVKPAVNALQFTFQYRIYSAALNERFREINSLVNELMGQSNITCIQAL